MFWIYILYSESLKKYYVGSTENVEKRVSEHNTGKGNFTSKGIPWKIVISIEAKTRGEAVRLELKIKKRGIERYIKDNNLVKFGT